MSSEFLWIAAVLASAMAWWLLRRPVGRAPASAPRELATLRSALGPVPASSPRPAPAFVATVQPLPDALAGFHWRTESDLDNERHATLIAAVRGIPRPPRSLQQLLSPEFVTRASSAELSELVMGEPLIAAKVLSTVNSPLYGLHRPVTNIGQAVTFLGISSVRSLCLQYMLAEAFKPTLAEAQKAFDAIWKASAIASELAVRLGKMLNLPDQASMSTQVVLGFVGQLATASLIPTAGMPQWLGRDRLERARLEQELLGLNAVEIGGLLMKSWELPATLVDDVNDMGRLLVTPPAAIEPERLPRIALGYLCAHLGEGLAQGRIPSPEALSIGDAVDTHHLRACLAHPMLARLPAALQSPELQAAVRQMLGEPAEA
ncbi:HDOD domain-containing protein [Hydrogenophaga taeniospiralis]|uniref:HDOD domain-containing protein n=1 Tax=Hydrogenophaga taeniospiralis TaxID=65656 RepID=UPI001CF98900|nr:HDOD domain-containing protein [Hydrogenophaga taeniospiralis]UCU93507.1 HDOD domain-containing protein [Hydrogenophaga taeniospiralis]